MKLVRAVATCGLLLVSVASLASGSIVTVDWKSIGGLDTFERQAVVFEPIQVNSFESFSSDGAFQNIVDTRGSVIKAHIYIRIAGDWKLFAEDNSIQGPHLSEFPLTGFSFLPLDFTIGPISGLNITNSGAGATNYIRMTDTGAGTRFNFNATAVPESNQLTLLIPGLLFLAGMRSFAQRWLAPD